MSELLLINSLIITVFILFISILLYLLKKTRLLISFLIVVLIGLGFLSYRLIIIYNTQPKLGIDFNEEFILIYEERHKRISYDGHGYEFKLDKSIEQIASDISDILDVDYTVENNAYLFNTKQVIIILEPTGENTYFIYPDTIFIDGVEVPFPSNLIEYHVFGETIRDEIEYNGDFSTLTNYYSQISNAEINDQSISIKVNKDGIDYFALITMEGNKLKFEISE